jgi:hypothetical protein
VPFSNSIVGGAETLIRSAIKSPNFVPGVSGWTINRDGTVEFNSGTFRGTITAGIFRGTNFEMNSAGLFFYSGTPAFGNLILALAPSSGTDSFGNTYAQGLSMTTPAAIRILTGTVMDNSGLRYYSALPAAGNLLLAVSPSAGTDSFGNAFPRGLQVKNPARVEFPGDETRESDPGNLTANTGGSAPADYSILYLSGPKSNGAGATDQVSIALFSANHDNTSTANMQLGWVSNAGVAQYAAVVDRSGLTVRYGLVCALEPNTGGSFGPVPSAATWQTFGALANGWAKAGGSYKYRLMGDNSVEVIMQNMTVGTSANGTTIITSANGLQVGWRPPMTMWKPVRADAMGGHSPSMQINTDGSMQCDGAVAAARWDLYCNFPMWS